MPTCRVCGETMPVGTRTCRECGSAMPDSAVSVGAARARARQTPVPPVPQELPAGGRFCPSCGTVYSADYTDTFCICGAELAGPPPEAAVVPVPATADGQVDSVPPTHYAAARPPAGTRCIVLYGDHRQPLHWFPLTKDATLIGRLDAPGGNFPDIDVDEWLDAATARRISRQHALILRSRVTGDFSLRPLPGNTGTQLEVEMILPLSDYPLLPGQRVILGGVARFKFEIA